MTAQIVAKEGSQVAHPIDEKLGVGDIVFLNKAMEERRRGIGSVAAVDIDLQEGISNPCR